MAMMSELKEAKRVLSGMGGGSRPTPVLAAVSGGLDSMCLLHLLSTWGRKQGLAVTAAHFHHGLRGETADRDAAFVREMCAAWSVPFVCGRGDTRACAEREGQSIEEAARTLRYAFLAEQQREQGCTFVLTAHHADDNAETMLLNLLRGTGARGLIGIPAARDSIVRPFLRVPRSELEAYAKEHDIPHVEDETNAEPDAARNVLRLKVLPVLRELNPRAVENMARTAELLLQDDDALNRQAELLLRSCARFGEDGAVELPEAFGAEQARAVTGRAILLAVTRATGHRQDISHTHVEAVRELLCTGRIGQSISLPYGVTALRMETGLLLRRENAPLPEESVLLPGNPVSFGIWQICLQTSEPPEGAYDEMVTLPASGTLTVSRWRSGDRMTLPGSRGSRSLKRLAADRGISPQQRDRLPVLRLDGRPVFVPGIGIEKEFADNRENPTVLVTFLRKTEEKNHEK